MAEHDVKPAQEVEANRAERAAYYKANRERQEATPTLSDEQIKLRYLHVAISEIGGCLTDLGRVLQQGITPENAQARGNIAAAFERAACYMRGQSFRAVRPEDNEGTTQDHPTG